MMPRLIRHILILSFAISMCGFGFASPGEDAANSFANQDFDSEIENYEALLKLGSGGADLHFNLGTAYAANRHVGPAVWNLIKAHRLAPRDSDIRHNLRVIAPEVPAQIAVFPLPPLQAVYDSLSLNEWTMLAAIATILSAALFSVLFGLTPVSLARRVLKKIAWVVLMVALASHSFAAVKYFFEAYDSRGVVVANEAHPYSAPSKGARTYPFALPPGTVVAIEDAGVAGWVKAVYGGSNEVFVPAEWVRIL